MLEVNGDTNERVPNPMDITNEVSMAQIAQSELIELLGLMECF